MDSDGPCRSARSLDQSCMLTALYATANHFLHADLYTCCLRCAELWVQQYRPYTSRCQLSLTCNLAAQAGESEKQKSYTAICQLPVPVTIDMLNTINNTKDLELHQQTPVRVSHRRADLVRHRTVFAMRCEPVPGSSHHIILQLRTQVCSFICTACNSPLPVKSWQLLYVRARLVRA